MVLANGYENQPITSSLYKCSWNDAVLKSNFMPDMEYMIDSFLACIWGRNSQNLDVYRSLDIKKLKREDYACWARSAGSGKMLLNHYHQSCVKVWCGKHQETGE